jgi:Uma2 family endonuclease
MSIAQKTRRPRKHPPGSAPSQSEQLFRMLLIDWPTYILYSDSLGPRHVRVTYADGEMELMTLFRAHERAKKKLAMFVEALAAELEIDIDAAGSMTFRREDLVRGLEPDECYWIQHESIMRDRNDHDPDRDPPPDLAIKVEVSRRTMDRMEIYAKLKVPEVWRWDGHRLTFCGLVRGRRYEEMTHSRAFPPLRSA